MQVPCRDLCGAHFIVVFYCHIVIVTLFLVFYHSLLPPIHSCCLVLRQNPQNPFLAGFFLPGLHYCSVQSSPVLDFGDVTSAISYTAAAWICPNVYVSCCHQRHSLPSTFLVVPGLGRIGHLRRCYFLYRGCTGLLPTRILLFRWLLLISIPRQRGFLVNDLVTFYSSTFSSASRHCYLIFRGFTDSSSASRCGSLANDFLSCFRWTLTI